MYFNPDYTEVDRVLDVRIVPKDESIDVQVENNADIEALLPETEYREHGSYRKEFRVKWRGLPYKDLSWEIFDDFQDSAAIVAYYDHLNRDVSTLNNPPSWRPSISEYRKLSVDTAFKDGNRLRDYQAEGVNWLLWNWVNRRNSILADEMGPGKTLQSTLFMHAIMRGYRVRPPFLVVAPLSTLPHWESEIQRWTELHVVVLHGSVESRENILKYEWRSKQGEFDVLLTTYEVGEKERSHADRHRGECVAGKRAVGRRGGRRGAPTEGPRKQAGRRAAEDGVRLQAAADGHAAAGGCEEDV